MPLFSSQIGIFASVAFALMVYDWIGDEQHIERAVQDRHIDETKKATSSQKGS